MKPYLKFKTVKRILLAMIVVLSVQCKKETNDYKVNYQVVLNTTIENFTNSDSVPTKTRYNITISKDDTMTISDSHSDFGFKDEDVDFDKDGTTELTINCSYSNLNNFLIRKSFQIINTNHNIEIGINNDITLGMNKDSIRMVKIFDNTDLIMTYQYWQKPVSRKNCFLSYFYDYSSHLYMDSLHVVQSKNVNINPDIKAKYFAIRKKINGNYVYGWVKFTIEKNEKLELSECSFYK